MKPHEIYTSTYHALIKEESTSSAEIVAELVMDLIRPSSVVDVGCGLGHWLRAFEELGVVDILGLDGYIADDVQLEIPRDRFLLQDFEEPLRVDRRFDLAICLEVAEHLPATVAEEFVTSLVAVADVVLFSAAIPFQGGEMHVNEQWPEYWAQLFQRHDYVAIDYVRPRVWRHPRVQYWYAQNSIVYVHRDLVDRDARLRTEYDRGVNSPLALVHPTTFLRGLHSASGAKTSFARKASNAVRRRMRRVWSV